MLAVDSQQISSPHCTCIVQLKYIEVLQFNITVGINININITTILQLVSCFQSENTLEWVICCCLIIKFCYTIMR